MSVTTTWNPMTHTDYDILKGKDVFSANGENVGSIKGIFHPNMDMPAARGRYYFLLDPGLIKDWFGGFDQDYLPESAIESVSADRVVLNLTSEQIKQRGQQWTTEPTGLASYRRRQCPPRRPRATEANCAARSRQPDSGPTHQCDLITTRLAPFRARAVPG
jgi:hypothetical protein